MQNRNCTVVKEQNSDGVGAIAEFIVYSNLVLDS